MSPSTILNYCFCCEELEVAESGDCCSLICLGIAQDSGLGGFTGRISSGPKPAASQPSCPWIYPEHNPIWPQHA